MAAGWIHEQLIYSKVGQLGGKLYFNYLIRAREFNKDNSIGGQAHGKHVGADCECDESGRKRVLDAPQLEYRDIRGRYNRVVFLYRHYRVVRMTEERRTGWP